jgi:vacuolar-type H+-ATPase subunit I/STV1
MMVNKILLYFGAGLPLFWGVAHLFPTNSVVKGFGNISLDNRRIITMEWIIEGVALIFIGVVISAVTYIDHTDVISKFIYIISFIFLNILSVISVMTGFKIKFLPFKLCPIIFTSSSIMILLGNHLFFRFRRQLA